jgi:dynein intermediate chain, cytosolic
VVVWDTRAKSLPVQRTPLSTSGHTHPVYSMAMVGSVNTHSLVTASSDGRVCLWNLNQLVQPAEVVEVRHDASGQQGEPSSSLSSPRGSGRPVSISAFAFDKEKVGPTLSLNSAAWGVPASANCSVLAWGQGADELVLGAESGHLYVAQLHKRPLVAQQYEAHFGLVTSLHRHPSTSKILSSWLLSSSVDWSMRLW